jgi:SAM-dependent methyltransferase
MPQMDMTKIEDDTDPNILFSKESWFGRYGLAKRARLDIVDRCVYWLKAVLQYKLPPAKSLDVGCSHGGFVWLLQAAGYTASGLELSPGIVDFAKQTFGIDVQQIQCKKEICSEEGFDIITLMDTVEHLQDPLGTLEQYLRQLKQDGILIIQMPSFPFGKSHKDLVKENSPFLSHLLKEQHFFLFSESAIVKLLKERLRIPYIQFEKAVFDHYDMFLIASRRPLNKYPEKQLEELLASKSEERVILAMLDMEKQNRELGRVCSDRLAVINLLQSKITESEKADLDQEKVRLERQNTELRGNRWYHFGQLSRKRKFIKIITILSKKLHLYSTLKPIYGVIFKCSYKKLPGK